jgi:hypothetical protein
MLSKDEYLDWKTTLFLYETKFVKYIKDSLKIDKKGAEFYFENQDFLEKNV